MKKLIYTMMVLLAIATLPTIGAEEEFEFEEDEREESLSSEREENGVEVEKEREGVEIEDEDEREDEDDGTTIGSGVSDLILYGTMVTIAAVGGYAGWKMYLIKKKSSVKSKV
jgi:hypothetical protein